MPHRRRKVMILEPVSPRGERYELPHERAAEFARWAGIHDPNGNFARNIHPGEVAADKSFCAGWQGIHNVRFLDRVVDGVVVEWVVIWGSPKHNMREFYDW